MGDRTPKRTPKRLKMIWQDKAGNALKPNSIRHFCLATAGKFCESRPLAPLFIGLDCYVGAGTKSDSLPQGANPVRCPFEKHQLARRLTDGGAIHVERETPTLVVRSGASCPASASADFVNSRRARRAGSGKPWQNNCASQQMPTCGSYPCI